MFLDQNFYTFWMFTTRCILDVLDICTLESYPLCRYILGTGAPGIIADGASGAIKDDSFSVQLFIILHRPLFF